MSSIGAPSEASRPRVSIGLPVFNGEAYLEEALDSIAAQTFTDFELIISDNASTDRTPEICQARASRDARIRYSRNPINIGGDRNYYRCFELSRGEYFFGVAHDDRLHPDYLRRVVEVLDADPSVVFCHSRACRLAPDGTVGEAWEAHPFSDSPRAPERFRDAIALRPVIAHFGIIRASMLRRMPPLAVYPDSDAYWQAEFALRGRLVELPEVLFFRRMRPDSGRAIPLHERIRWSRPAKAGALSFPSWRRPAEYARAVLRSPLTLPERIKCLREIGRYLRERGLRMLTKDLRAAARNLLNRTSVGRRILVARSRARNG